MVIDTSTPLFSFDDVWVGAEGAWRVCGVEADVPASGVTAIVGPSGSGKSTLLRLGNRLQEPARGTVRFRGADVAGLDPLALRRSVGMVFQRPTPFPGTVAENLRVAAPGASRDEMTAALSQAEMPAEFLDRQATELSGGEAQRVCLARTLLTHPEALLMDEPTSALDPAARLALERLAGGLAERGVPIVWVTHDLAQVRRIADSVLVMIDGTVAHRGRPGSLAAGAPDSVRRFLEGASDAE